MKHALHKTEGGLIRIALDAGERINEIMITGDFFIYPEDSIEALEKELVGTAVRNDEILKVVKGFYENVEAPGIEPEDLVEAIRKAVVK